MAAKKGGAVALQQDVTTDEEWAALLRRPGLLLVDIYSEWCGPCVGMVGNLKKIKVELGGDLLVLATARADGISALERHRKHSEPIWMLVSGGRLINLIFGADAPKIARLIASELDNEVKRQKGEDVRKYMSWDELTPEEEARLRAAEEKRLRQLAEEEERLAQELIRQRAANYAKLAGKLLRYTPVLFLPHAVSDGRAMEVLVSLREAWTAAGLHEVRELALHVSADMANEIFFEHRLPQHDDLVKALEAGPCTAIMLCKDPVEVEVPAPVPEEDPAAADASVEDGAGELPEDSGGAEAAVGAEAGAETEQQLAEEAAPPAETVPAAPAPPAPPATITVLVEPELGEVEAIVAKSLYGFFPSADGAVEAVQPASETQEWPPVDTAAAACVLRGAGSPALPGVWTPLTPSTKAAAMQTLFPDDTRELTKPPPPPSVLPPSTVMVFSIARTRDVLVTAAPFEGSLTGQGYFDAKQALVAASEAEYEVACQTRDQGCKDTDVFVVAVAAESTAALEAIAALQPLSASASEEEAKADCNLYFPGPQPDTEDQGYGNEHEADQQALGFRY